MKIGTHEPSDPTEKLNPSRNPGLAYLASALGIDYLTVAIAFLHPGTENISYIEKVRQAIERVWG